MDLSDRIFIATLATLFLLVLILERRNRMTMAQLKPPSIGDWLLRDTNVPHCRTGANMIDDVAYLDVTDAAQAGNENT